MGDRWAVVRDGVVETVIAWSGVAKSPKTPWGLRLDPAAEYVELADGVACGPGWTRSGDGWTPPPVVRDAAAELAAAEADRIARGYAWRRARLSLSIESRAAWLFLATETAAGLVETYDVRAAPTIDGSRPVELQGPDDILEAYRGCGGTLVSITKAAVAARELAEAIPTSACLDLLLEALAAEDPWQELESVLDLVATLSDPSDPPAERAAAAALLGLGGTP
jgi:hypothetical protein